MSVRKRSPMLFVRHWSPLVELNNSLPEFGRAKKSPPANFRLYTCGPPIDSIQVSPSCELHDRPTAETARNTPFPKATLFKGGEKGKAFDCQFVASTDVTIEPTPATATNSPFPNATLVRFLSVGYGLRVVQ